MAQSQAQACCDPANAVKALRHGVNPAQPSHKGTTGHRCVSHFVAFGNWTIRFESNRFDSVRFDSI